MKEPQDSDYVCVDCIESADCYVKKKWTWYHAHSCIVCDKKADTMKIRFINIKENEDE